MLPAAPNTENRRPHRDSIEGFAESWLRVKVTGWVILARGRVQKVNSHHVQEADGRSATRGDTDDLVVIPQLTKNQSHENQRWLSLSKTTRATQQAIVSDHDCPHTQITCGVQCGLWGGFIASFSSFFSSYIFTVLHHSHHSHEVLFGCNRQLFSSNKPQKPNTTC